LNKNVLLNILVLVAIIGSTFLAGCLAGSGEETKKEILRVWLDATPEELVFFSEVANEFKQSEKDLEIEFRVVKLDDLKPAFLSVSGIASGPDLILIPGDWVGELALKKQICELNLANLKIDSAFLECAKFNGKTYLMPWCFETVALIYNKKLLSTPPVDYKELASISPNLIDRDIYPLMYDNKNFYYHAPWFFGCKAKIFAAEKIAINSVEAKKSVEFGLKLENEKIIPIGCNQPATVNLFCAGKTAMIINGPWILNELDRNAVNYGVEVIPALNENLPARPFFGVKGFAIAQTSGKSEQAMRFARFFNSNFYQKAAMERLNVLPCNQEVYNDSYVSGKYKGFYQQAKNGVPMPNNPEMKFVWNEANWLLRQAYKTGANIDFLLEEAKRKIESQINSERINR
jgi:arabinogalactan oligomer/maltooligosaccharide transport system substrate-binding protein